MTKYLREPSEPPAIKDAMAKASKRKEKGLPVSNFASGNVGQMPINLKFMDMDIQTGTDLPQELKSLSKAMERGIKKAFEKPRGLSYSTTGGLDKQKDLALRYFKDFHDIEHEDRERVIVTPGGQRALSASLRSIQPGTKIFMSQWEYAPALPIIKENNCEPIKIDVDEKLRPEIDELREKVEEGSVFYTSMPNNPSGYVSPELFSEVVEVMVENEGGVIWDAPYIFTILKLNDGKAKFNDDFLREQLERFNSTLSEYSDHICLLSSISKTCLVAGLRFGFATGPKKWIDNMNNILGREELSSPTAGFMIGQEVLSEFLKKQETYKWLDKILANRLNVLIDNDLPLILPDNGKFGSLYVLMRTGEMDGKEFIDRAYEQYGIVPIPAEAFYGEPINAVRLSLVSTPWSEGDKEWKENVENLKEALEEITE
ncbi:MAG: pyridoxal phosphate-dependent aminotransferase [Candidatus Thermoplasmatota archaeon]|nr:pyridoxal phosphate-dependent aminotransferase [Candidatus Thermoplasmatota archaeon]MBS3790600.1 pyridoxal phosphate-dependent aminotransferase [Candidatus Thermoplasmatota archaeon]